MESKTAESRHPEEKASFVSRFLLWWIVPLLWKGWRRPLQQEDLHCVKDKDQSSRLTEHLESKWREEILKAKRDNRAPKLWRAMLHYFSIQEYFIYVLFYLIIAIGQNVSWYSLIKLLQLVSNFQAGSAEDNARIRENAMVYIYGVAMGSLMELVGRSRFNLHGATSGNKANVGTLGLLYKKILRLSKKSIDTGNVMELICNDSQRLVTSGEWFIPTAIRFMLYAINAIAWLVYFIGWQVLPGIFFLIVFSVLQISCNSIDYRLRVNASKLSDKRLGYIREWLSMIYSIKVNCWENIFQDKIKKIRWEEIKLKTKRWFISFICYAFIPCSQSLATFITVCTLSLTEREEMVNLNFLAMFYLFGRLGEAVTEAIPTTVRLVSDVSSALQRIETFLQKKEHLGQEGCLTASFAESHPSQDLLIFSSKVDCLDKESKPLTNLLSHNFICFHDVICELPSNAHNIPKSVKANCAGASLLKGITLEVSKPGLVVIFGDVGSGKSSLLETVIGELVITRGTVKCSGKIAFVSDSPWVFPGTVRENILFGLPYNEARYKKIIKACQLERDFDSFPQYDLNRIGEHSTVSGGQRTRIALARAVYSDADVYLLDDPLSSLDVSVAQNVFTCCIRGLLSDRIVLMTSHMNQYFPDADHLVHVEEGRIVNQGDFEAMKPTLQMMMSNLDQRSTKESKNEHAVWSAIGESSGGVNLEEERENRQSGRVSLKLWFEYFHHGASLFFLILIPVLYFSGAGFLVFVDVTASHLPKIAGKGKLRFEREFLLYTVVLVVGVTLIVVGSLSIFLLLMRAVYKVHNSMVACLMKAPLLFYARNPVGRIINRFSQDMNILDELLPYYVYLTCYYISTVLGATLLAFVTNLLLIIPFVLFLPVFYLIGNIYLTSSTDIKRLMLMTADPMFSHFSTTIEGLRTVRVHGRQRNFTKQLFSYVDDHSATVLSFYTSFRCFGIICSGMTTMMGIIVTIAVVYLINDSYTAALGSVAILYVINTNQSVESMIRFSAGANTQMTSAERTVAFTKIPPEIGHSLCKHPPKQWPQDGGIEFQGVSLWYYEDGPKVLKNISFKVNAKEKIGIVGRTGAGKSSLIAALMRLALIEGDIFVDGLNIREVDVISSRRVISVISQAPNLMNGTVKTNLDPSNECSDTEIWSALAQTKMSSTISSLPRKLQNEISSGGSSFSLGERQLMHLTRVLLKKSKIIIFDEATGKVDKKTDDDIQSIVRDVCKECTVITIAHRMSTVLGCDRILILDQGQIVDFDTPQALLTKENSVLNYLLEISP